MTQNEISTAQLAAQLNMRPDSIIEHRLRKPDRTFFGIAARKAPNGKLYWPADTAARVLGIADHQGEVAA